MSGNVRCPNCGTENQVDADNKFCKECGKDLSKYVIVEDDVDYIVCPKCNAKNSKKSKFCGECGANLKEFEDSQNKNENIEIDKPEKETEFVTFNEMDATSKKIIAILFVLIVIAASTFGVIQYNQYQKDIEPLYLSLNFNNMGNASLKTQYDKLDKTAKIQLVFDDQKVEDWQIEYFNGYYQNKLGLEIKDENNQTITAQYKNIDMQKGKKPIANFAIYNLNAKNFAKIKSLFQSASERGQYIISAPYALYLSKNKNYIAEKSRFLKYKREVEAKAEAERKRKEWQDKVLSSCVYKTSDGVCFTTQAVDITSINEDRTDYWQTAKDYCTEQRYKLPSDNDLRSLAADYLGIKINSGTEIETVKNLGSTIPNNYEILKLLLEDDRFWNNFCFWEDKEFNNEKAYMRCILKNILGEHGTVQVFKRKSENLTAGISSLIPHYAICVYDPNR